MYFSIQKRHYENVIYLPNILHRLKVSHSNCLILDDAVAVVSWSVSCVSMGLSASHQASLNVNQNNSLEFRDYYDSVVNTNVAMNITRK